MTAAARRPRVLLTAALPDPAPRILEPLADVRVLERPPSAAELAGELADGVDVVLGQLVDPFTADVLRAGAPGLRAVCLYAVGFSNVDTAAASRANVVVTNTPDVLTDDTADLAVALMLAVGRRLLDGDREVRAGRFTGWRPDLLLGRRMHGSVLGLAGFGRIGQAVARRALAFGMRVRCTRRPGATDTTPAAPLPADLAGRVEEVNWPELLSSCDVLSLHVPLTPGTHHLVDGAALAAMKRSAIVINTARGPVVDEAALVHALDTGVIAGAGLDVYEDEPRLAPGLDRSPGTVLLPHVGSATLHTRRAMAELCARNAVHALAGTLPPQAVNPDAWGGQLRPDLTAPGRVPR
ncbi:2-hydroxyacid dehydrogenase [Streptomyces sp. NPDC050161]|uniref:2-hydroxyacid dehydrogenase n=1 Tax=Streptomyces sp. NPDC050161 TaxID=3365604 RepID=UPI00379D0494